MRKLSFNNWSKMGEFNKKKDNRARGFRYPGDLVSLSGESARRRFLLTIAFLDDDSQRSNYHSK